MKKIFFASIALLLALASCDEWDQVLTLKYDEPDSVLKQQEENSRTLKANTTIAGLKQMYIDNGSKAKELSGDIWIAGQVISSDASGNIYRELYIQDATGAIDVKIGKSSSSADYKLGQWVYIKCDGLTVGSYSGMPQLGVEDETGEYETAYIDSDYIIASHIFRGVVDKPLEPSELTESDITKALSEGGFKNDSWGRYVTIKGLKYGAATTYSTDHYKRIFCLLYIDPNKDKKAQSNRVFLSDKTYGVTTWAMTKNKFISNLDAGLFDSAETGDDRPLDDEIKAALRSGADAVTLSHYFSLGATPVQIRTSGYSKFADTEIDPAILGDPEASFADGVAIDVTGILTIYDGQAQFTLIDLGGVSLSASEPK